MSPAKVEAHSHPQAMEKILLSSGMPLGPDMSLEIRRIVIRAKSAQDREHLKLPEAAFLNTYVIPGIVRCLREVSGLNEAQARELLLNECHRSMPETAAVSPIQPLIGGVPPEIVGKAGFWAEGVVTHRMRSRTGEQSGRGRDVTSKIPITFRAVGEAGLSCRKTSGSFTWTGAASILLGTTT